MWIDVHDKPIPTHRKHGEMFLLNLQYHKYYGHDIPCTGDVVAAIWDSVEECFFEKHTGLTIDDRDIVEWWKE